MLAWFFQWLDSFYNIDFLVDAFYDDYDNPNPRNPIFLLPQHLASLPQSPRTQHLIHAPSQIVIHE